MKKKLKFLITVLLITPFLFNSCKEDPINVDYHIGNKTLRPLEIAMPISQIYINMERWITDLLDSQAFIHWVGKDSVLHVEYHYSEIIERKDMASDTKFERKNKEFKFGIFDNLQITQNFAFGNILYTVKGTNKIGAQFNLSLENIRMTKDDDWKKEGFTYFLKENGNGSIPLQVKVGANSEELKKLNNNNSNILDMGTECYPNKFVFDLINRNANNSGSNNPTDYLKIDMSLLFPMEFRTELYDRKDTTDFDVRKILNNDKGWAESLEFMNLYINVDNKFPFDVRYRAYVIDDKDNIVHYIKGDKDKAETFVGMGVPSSSGLVSTPTKKENIITIVGDDIVKFYDKNVKKIVIQTMSTSYEASNGKSVKIFANTGMDLKIMMEAKVKVPSNIR